MPQGVQEQIGTLATVEPEAHLIQVGGEMLGTDFVPCSNNAALQKRERGFHRVGMNVTASVFLRAVVNLLMRGGDAIFPHGRAVHVVIVSHDDVYVLADVLRDVLRQRAAFDILGMEETEIAAALPDADYDFLVGTASALLYSFAASADIVSSISTTTSSMGRSISRIAARMRWQRYHAVL